MKPLRHRDPDGVDAAPDGADVLRALEDPQAFWALIEPYDRRLRALAYRVTGDADRMDDALQEAYVRAFRSLPSFRGGAGIGTWLYRIVYNAAVDEVRRAERTRHEQLDDEFEPGAGGRGADLADRVAHRQDLAAALATLPVDMRAAVLLVDAEGMSYDQAAEVLGIPPGTVASRLHRARHVLRNALTGGDR